MKEKMNTRKKNDTKQNGILEELRRITKLLVLIATRDQRQKEQIRILSNIGFRPKDIAQLIDTTSNTVRVTLAEIKKEKGQKGKTKGKRPPIRREIAQG